MWWTTIATAAPLQLQLQLVDEMRWADEIEVLSADGVTLDLEEGFVFPVRSGDAPEPVGYVFVGVGAARFPFAERREALAFADTLAAQAGADEAAARRALDALAWTEAFDIALVISGDPSVVSAIDQLPVVLDTRDDVVYLDTEPQEVVVRTWRIGQARMRANAALANRVQRLAGAGLDPRVMLAEAPLEPATGRWLAEVHTERVWRPFIEPATASTQDQWLSFGHDPSGIVDDRYRDVVFVHGLLDRSDQDPVPRLRVLTGAPHAAPAAGAQIERAVVNAVVQPGTTAHGVTFEAVLTLRTDVDTRLVPLAVPVADVLQLQGLVATHQHRVVAVETIDGRPLTPMGHGGFGPRRPAGAWAVDSWVLPATLPAGGRTAIRVRWTDHWAASHVLDVPQWITHKLLRAGVCLDLDCACFMRANGPPPPPGLEVLNPDPGFRGMFPAATDLGGVALAEAVVPLVPGRSDRFPAEIRTGTTLGTGWLAAIDGRVTEQRSGDGRLWIAQSTGAGRVSFGQLRESRAPAVGPFPAVRVLHHDAMSVDPSFVRSVLRFYRGALPAFPGDAVTVVQGPSSPVVDPMVVAAFPCPMNKGAIPALRPKRHALTVREGDVPMDRDAPWAARTADQILISGLAEIGNQVGGIESSVRQRYPRLIERYVAEAIAARWWVDVGEGERDAWIAPAAATVYRDAFVREAFPEAVARWDEIRVDDLQEALGRRAFVPLSTQLEPYSGEAGGWVLRALGARIGEPALLRGLDAFLQGDDHRTDALAAALSSASGNDVRAWFDTWVHVGARPSVTAEWSVSAGGAEVTLEADLPFGRFEVPVVVTTAANSRTHWVEIRDGVGAATLPAEGRVLRVEVDPAAILPLRKRASTRRAPSDRDAGAPAPQPPQVASGSSG